MKPIKFETHSYYSYDGKLDKPNITIRTEDLDVFLCRENLFSYTLEKIGIIPPLQVINSVLQSGKAVCYYWDPFELSEAEYVDLCRVFKSKTNGYCIEDQELWTHTDPECWKKAVVEKIKTNPFFKPIHWWSVQNDLIGIPIGENQWIIRGFEGKRDEAFNIDPMIKPLKHLFRSLETACVAACCGMAAFNFFPENILDKLTQQDKLDVLPLLDYLIQEIDAMPDSVTHFKSERLNSVLSRQEFLSLIRHITRVISKE